MRPSALRTTTTSSAAAAAQALSGIDAPQLFAAAAIQARDCAIARRRVDAVARYCRAEYRLLRIAYIGLPQRAYHQRIRKRWQRGHVLRRTAAAEPVYRIDAFDRIAEHAAAAATGNQRHYGQREDEG